MFVCAPRREKLFGDMSSPILLPGYASCLPGCSSNPELVPKSYLQTVDRKANQGGPQVGQVSPPGFHQECEPSAHGPSVHAQNREILQDPRFPASLKLPPNSPVDCVNFQGMVGGKKSFQLEFVPLSSLWFLLRDFVPFFPCFPRDHISFCDR